MPPIRSTDEDAASDHSPGMPRNLRFISSGKSLPVSRETPPQQCLSDEAESAGPVTISRLAERKSTNSVKKSSKSGSKNGDRASYAAANTIIIKGQKLRPTVAFDTFWRFAAERKAIDDRRRSGMPAPWTDDEILRKWRFCNTFRILDKVSQYIVTNVIEEGPQDPVEIVFRVTLFNLFTKIETWELLQDEIGPLTWATYSRKAYQDVLGSAKYDGKTLYTGSFQKPAPDFGHKDAYMNHLALLEVLMDNDFPGQLTRAVFMADIFEWLAAFPSMGYFTTYQLLLNLSYSSVINFSDMDFVVPGLGASSGLTKLFGRSMSRAKKAVPGIEIDVIRWLAKTQTQHFRRLDLDFTFLGPDRMPMELADIEHTLCDVDKYARIAHPELKGLHGRTELRGPRFEPSTVPYPMEPRLPVAWSNPARNILRIRPGEGLPVIDKRYTVARVGGRREGKNGVEYLVFWAGYGDEDATWEPEKCLVEDAPEAVKEFLSKSNEPRLWHQSLIR